MSDKLNKDEQERLKLFAKIADAINPNKTKTTRTRTTKESDRDYVTHKKNVYTIKLSWLFNTNLTGKTNFPLLSTNLKSPQELGKREERSVGDKFNVGDLVIYKPKGIRNLHNQNLYAKIIEKESIPLKKDGTEYVEDSRFPLALRRPYRYKTLYTIKFEYPMNTYIDKYVPDDDSFKKTFRNKHARMREKLTRVLDIDMRKSDIVVETFQIDTTNLSNRQILKKIKDKILLKSLEKFRPRKRFYLKYIIGKYHSIQQTDSSKIIDLDSNKDPNNKYIIHRTPSYEMDSLINIIRNRNEKDRTISIELPVNLTLLVVSNKKDQDKGMVDNIEDYIKNISSFCGKRYTDFKKIGKKSTSRMLINEKKERLKELKSLESINEQQQKEMDEIQEILSYVRGGYKSKTRKKSRRKRNKKIKKNKKTKKKIYRKK